MKRFSIRHRLVLLLLSGLVLVWTGMLAASYYEAREEVDELADERLEQNAHTLLLLDLKRLGTLADVEDEEEHDDDHGKHLGFQVWSNSGQLLLRGDGSPPAAFDPRSGFTTLTLGDEQWRSYALHDRKHGYQVRVFEPLRQRVKIGNKVARRMAQSLLIALPILALLIWLAIGRGLQPLELLSRAIATRNAGNLEPIALDRVPVEAQLLIDSLNNLLERLSDSLDRERSFTADAAHELRTPLAAIKVQAEVALAAKDMATRKHAIEQVIAGVNRTTHLAQQLLLLARLDHAGAAAAQAVDLGKLAVDGVAQRAGDAARKGIEFDVAAQPGCILQGDPTALSVMLDNLLDNAIKYGRQNGRIAVAVARDRAQLALSVKDDGPGVSPQARARLADRFFRIEGSEVPGSGLGLSIVEKIAASCRGTVSFGEGLNGHGLGVTIHFQA
jgi:two-component system sensor histidine kinase QseC